MNQKFFLARILRIRFKFKQNCALLSLGFQLDYECTSTVAPKKSRKNFLVVTQ